MSSSTSIADHMVTTSPSVRVTRWWMPSPSTTTLATRLQSSPLPGPATASATIATCVVVSTNHAWSSSSFLAFVRPLLLLELLRLLTMLATSSSWFARVTVTFSGSLILSAQLILVTRSVIAVP